MNWTDLGLRALEALAPLVLALVGWGVAELTRLVRARTRNVYVQGVTERLGEAVRDVVAELEQTTVDEIRKAREDGQITASEAHDIKEKAKGLVELYLGRKGLRELERIFDRDAVERMIESKIEAAVLELRGRA